MILTLQNRCSAIENAHAELREEYDNHSDNIPGGSVSDTHIKNVVQEYVDTEILGGAW
jgi:hypothetical protein